MGIIMAAYCVQNVTYFPHFPQAKKKKRLLEKPSNPGHMLTVLCSGCPKPVLLNRRAATRYRALA
jgi:hypothetical protein